MQTEQPSIPPAWQAARRVLAVRLDNLGDVLVTTPAIRAVAESLPQAEITLLASQVGAQAGKLNPTISDVVVYRAPWMDPWQQLPHDSRREQQVIAALRERRFDGAIIFGSFRQSPLPAAYLCYLADIPLRLAASVDGPGSLLTTRHKHPERMLHEVERGLDLVSAIGMQTDTPDLLLDLPPGAHEALAARLPELRGSGPLIVLHPGCSMPARTYPWEQFAAAADLLVEKLGARVVLTGAADEQPLLTSIAERMRQQTLLLAGTLPFAEFGALIAAADLLITNNTGPMHMAAALKTPVVVLFALTNPPEQWGPWRVPHRLLFHDVPCRICYSRVCPYGHECLRLVTPGVVVDAAATLLAETGRAALPGRQLVAEERR